jgi:hypothetical protein
MFHTAQDLSESASGYKKLTLTKNLSKKRGRACSKRRRDTLDNRIMRQQLIVSYMNREFRREMNQFEKTVRESGGKGMTELVMPESLAALKENVKLAEGNLLSARSAKAGMDKFPPLR